jgi:hypothetical protein
LALFKEDMSLGAYVGYEERYKAGHMVCLVRAATGGEREYECIMETLQGAIWSEHGDGTAQTWINTAKHLAGVYGESRFKSL